jgi:hypothetical protein
MDLFGINCTHWVFYYPFDSFMQSNTYHVCLWNFDYISTIYSSPNKQPFSLHFVAKSNKTWLEQYLNFTIWTLLYLNPNLLKPQSAQPQVPSNQIKLIVNLGYILPVPSRKLLPTLVTVSWWFSPLAAWYKQSAINTGTTIAADSTKPQHLIID